MKRNISITSLVIAVAVFFILGFSLSDRIERDPNSPKKGGPYELRGPALDNPLSPLSESFEGTTFPPAGWVRLSPLGNAGWNRQLSGTSPLPGWTGGGGITVPVNGGIACAYVTYGEVAANNNEWLITPQITNVQPTDSLKFWMRYIVPEYSDSFSVKISTTTQTIAAMTVPVLARRLSGVADTGWTEYKFNIGSLVPAGSNIYIGFQESIVNNITNGSAITVDLVTVTAGSTGITNYNGEIPSSFNLSQNFPNPFNPSTNINFSIPKSGLVTLKIYDMVGREVSTLVNEFKSAGNYIAGFSGANLTSGTYFYRLESDNFVETKKMLLIK